jgi:hypothetical protein
MDRNLLNDSSSTAIDLMINPSETLRCYLSLSDLLYVLKYSMLPCRRADLCFSYANMWLHDTGSHRTRIVGSPSQPQLKHLFDDLTPLSIHAKDTYFFKFSAGNAESLALWDSNPLSSVIVAIETTADNLSKSILVRDE